MKGVVYGSFLRSDGFGLRLILAFGLNMVATCVWGDSLWEASQWLSVKDAPVYDAGRDKGSAAEGTSWFVANMTNAKAVVSATWRTTALGVYEIYVNGNSVGNEALKPGFTNRWKTRLAFCHDVTKLLDCAAGARNVLAAEVGAGWWRDKIVGFGGRKSAFRGILEITYADGSRGVYCTNDKDWTCSVGGPVRQSGIFEGEAYDARVAAPKLGEGVTAKPEVNTEFRGEIVPTPGAEVFWREDLAMDPVDAYCWKGVEAAGPDCYGKVVKTRSYRAGETMVVLKGETLVVDFGQNCAAVPDFLFEAAAGTELTVLPGEALNEANGAKARGNDGPEGSIYRRNLRLPPDFMRVKYVFSGSGVESYRPRFTFYGYRFASLTATDTVRIRAFRSVPVTSITPEMEIGTIETGDKDVNRLIANVRWGQLSNYLSVPTDCPQRNERLGWAADTQVFCEAGSFGADTRRFFQKWMRDMRDCQYGNGGFAAVAPSGHATLRLGWTDAGIIVPYQVWKQFGDNAIVEQNWEAMERYMALLDKTRFETAAIGDVKKAYQWADWLSCEKYESFSEKAFEKGADGKLVPRAEAVKYWDYLGGCHWLADAQMMAAMARGTGRDAAKYEQMAEKARAHVKARFFAAKDGMIDPLFRDMQTPALFALRLGLVEGEAKARTIKALRENFAAHGDCLQTGFLGTAILLDTLSENGMNDLAYTLLLQHRHPSWLYSVDQGATTIWERWNSYTRKDGFGSSGMNSFNHYAYGSVLAWIYKTAAGIAADPAQPGFRRIVMRPVPNRRLGYVRASYRSAAGLVTSAWRYEDSRWIWEFSVPEGAVAEVTLPNGTAPREYAAGKHRVELELDK